MIYSSTVFSNASALKSSEVLIERGVKAIELSAGEFVEDQISRLKPLSKNIEFQVHNYFPPPRSPFVLNLASTDNEIASQSMKHVEHAMRFAIELGNPRYSFHAGFLFDPKVNELGSNISRQAIKNKKECTQIFKERVHNIADRARDLGVQLLIENNVLSRSNFTSFGTNPFLMASPDEIIDVMKEMPGNVGLLMDVAHLKVTSRTLGFDASAAMEKCARYTCGYHLSENDGISDLNAPIQPKSWFWRHLEPSINYVSIEVKGVTVLEILQQRKLAHQMLGTSDVQS